MTTVILTIHTLIVLALIGVVLLQRSDGGALGIGGGGGGMMSGRGAANALTRTTSILAALFFSTSLGLAIFASGSEDQSAIIEGLTGEEVRDPNAPLTSEDLLRNLGAGREDAQTDVDNDALDPDNLLEALGTDRPVAETAPAEGGAGEGTDDGTVEDTGDGSGDDADDGVDENDGAPRE